MKLNPEPLIASDEIQRRVTKLAAQISADFHGRELLLIIVLRGGLIFAADLMRSLTLPVTIDFIRARSYNGAQSSGQVDFVYLPEDDIRGKHVLVVEDIIDTGRTSKAIMEFLASKSPANLSLCALLDKPSRREIPIQADYVGFSIDDHFVVGYGLDHNQRARELPHIHVWNPNAILGEEER